MPKVMPLIHVHGCADHSRDRQNCQPLTISSNQRANGKNGGFLGDVVALDESCVRILGLELTMIVTERSPIG